jgi:hypothetical protein
MSILRFPSSPVNPDLVNPRSSWPDWVDFYRWSATPSPDFLPTLDEDREADELLDDDGPSDAELDLMAMAAAWMTAAESGPAM